MIPQASLSLRLERLNDAVLRASASVVDSDILGARVASFEAAFADFVGTQYCVMINSGMDDELGFRLKRGVSTAVHDWSSPHDQPAFQGYGSSLPITSRIPLRLLSLPIQPEVAAPNLDTNIRAVLDGVGGA